MFVRCGLLKCLLLIALITSPCSAAEYQTVIEAWNAGVAALRSGNHAASQEPFEAALKMTEDDRMKMRIHEALLASYRLLPEPDKFVETSEYIIENAEYDAKKSLTRTALLSFMFQRGKLNDLEDRYTKNIAGKKKQELSHYILMELYGRYNRKPELAITHTKAYAELTKDSGVKVSASQLGDLGRQFAQAGKLEDAAKKYEEAAESDEKTASWYLKEAADCWMKLGNEDEALAAVQKAEKLGPDTRTDQLTHFWHRKIGEIYLDLDKPKEAIPHLKAAIENTKIDGYIKACQEALAKAEAAAN